MQFSLDVAFDPQNGEFKTIFRVIIWVNLFVMNEFLWPVPLLLFLWPVPLLLLLPSYLLT